MSVFPALSWFFCQWNMFLVLRSKTFSWVNGNLFLLGLSPLSKQEAARAEYKRLKREMMETKRKKDIEEEKRSGEIFLVKFCKCTWVSLLQAFRWWGWDWIVRAWRTRGEVRTLSTIWTPGTGYTWVGSVTMHRIVKMPWWRKKAITKQVKTVGVSGVKMPMRVILHWIPNPSLYNRYGRVSISKWDCKLYRSFLKR